MALIDSLVKIFPDLSKIELKAFQNINLGIGPFINIQNNVTNKNTLHLDVSQLTPEQKKHLPNALRSAIAENIDILEEHFEQEKERYQNVIAQDENAQLLEYFRDKIPQYDLHILQAALYLKSILTAGQSTGKIKYEIMQKYGQRGRNISNLCSANYFLTWLKPLYEQMSKSQEFTLKKFQSVYEEVVMNQPFTIFVNHGMTTKQLETLIVEKMNQMRSYGLENLFIHGIGKTNVDKILASVKVVVTDNQFSTHPAIENHIIVVTLKRKS